MADLIKDVAIYLRKSRDETGGTEDVLSKHEGLLVEYAKKNEFRYTIYKEIGSSQSIDDRPEMIRLVKDLYQDLYDAVLVVDIDRLGRGDLEEQGRITRILKETNTFVILPSGTMYDFNNEDQELEIDMKQFFARIEYRAIKKRFNRGKKLGAKQGKWVNGTPPFPYVYNKFTKSIEVDKESLDIYNTMKKLFLEDMLTNEEVAIELNKRGSLTSRGKNWSSTAIQRILTSPVHLGKVVYGKTSGSGHLKNKGKKGKGLKVRDKEDWIIGEGSHEKLKTEAEHERIMAILEKRRLKPKGKRENVYPLSRIMICSKCGRAMSIITQRNGTVYVRTCNKKDHFGNKCWNKGINIEYIYKALNDELNKYEQQLLSHTEEEKTVDVTLERALERMKKELENLEQGFQKLRRLYVRGSMGEAEYDKEEKELQQDIQSKREEIAKIEKSLGVIQATVTKEERLGLITRFKEQWNSEAVNPKELNNLAKTIIERIDYNHDENGLQLHFEFL